MDNSQKKNQCIHWQWQSEKSGSFGILVDIGGVSVTDRKYFGVSNCVLTCRSLDYRNELSMVYFYLKVDP